MRPKLWPSRKSFSQGPGGTSKGSEIRLRKRLLPHSGKFSVQFRLSACSECGSDEVDVEETLDDIQHPFRLAWLHINDHTGRSILKWVRCKIAKLAEDVQTISDIKRKLATC